MKFFNKALVASAILAATNTAYAADLTDAKVDHSVQGLEVAAAAAESSIRVIVREQLEAGDQITLVFGAGVSGITSVAVDGSGDATATAADNALGLVYGSGTYKLRPVSVTTAPVTGVVTVVVEVATGDPVTKDSSFEVQVRGANLVKAKASASTVTYSAVSGLTGDPKDTTGDNTGLLITTADQYSASVKTKANGVINRSPATSFVSGGTAANNDIDTLVVTVKDNQSLLAAASGTAAAATVTLAGDFSFVADNTGTVTVATTSGDDVLGAVAIAADEKSATFTVTDTVAADGIAGDLTVTLDSNALDGGATEDIPVTAFTATVSVDADTGSATNTKQEALSAADAGEWEADATIINVPYMPVGKEGTSVSVHFANESKSAVDVIVSAIDADGNVYDAVDLGKDLAKQTVTKVSQTELISLFDLPTDSVTKLSVTFNIDADKGDVNGYAFTTDETGRTEISTSQQRGN